MLVRLLGNLFRLLLWPYFALRRLRGVRRGAFVHVTIDGAIVDIAPEPRFWERWRAPRPRISLHALGRLVDDVIADDRVRGVLVTLRSARGGMASARSLRQTLARLREGKRELVVHLPLGGLTKELYVASCADRVYVGPRAHLAPLGFAGSTRYVRRALDRAGVEVEVFARGRFKSAGEQLVRDSMSEPQREQLGALLDAMHADVVEALASGRGLSAEQAAAVIDGAPYDAEEAIAARLVDGVAYEDEVRGLLTQGGAPPAVGQRAGRTPAFPPVIEASRYLSLVRGARWKPLLRPRAIGVVQVHGAIASGDAPLASGAIDERVIAAVRAARSNPRVAAVVLHVNSPGGSALASDRIHHELEQLAAEKPLVACFADVAASGGYYVAAAAHTIVAQPTTITGSIGVVAARPVIGPLLGKLGIATEVVKRGAHSDVFQPHRHLTDDERAAFERELESTYRAFKGVVARGRKRKEDEIERVAQGRVWSGIDAEREGLVDVLGGFSVACDRARALAARTLGEARAHALEPVVVRGARHPGLPLDPPRRAAATTLATLARDLGLALPVGLLTAGRDRVLAWCELGETFLR